MPKKYIKGKNGKFKGSLPDPTMLPKTASLSSLPTLPTNTSKPLESITGGLSGNLVLTDLPKAKLENSETSLADFLIPGARGIGPGTTFFLSRTPYLLLRLISRYRFPDSGINRKESRARRYGLLRRRAPTLH